MLNRYNSYSYSNISVKHPKTDYTTGDFEFNAWSKNDISNNTFNYIANQIYNPTLSSTSDRWVNLDIDLTKALSYVGNISSIYFLYGNNGNSSRDPYIAKGSSYWNSTYIYLRIFAMDFKPTNVRSAEITQAENRLPITVNWVSDYQDLFDFVVKQNGVVKYSTSGTTAKTATIPANTLEVGAFTVEITAANNPLGDDFGRSDNYTFNFNATGATLPIIYSLEPNGINQNIDQAILVHWESLNQSNYSLNIKQNGIVISNFTGTTAKSVNIPPNTCGKGNVTLELTISNIVGGATASTTRTSTFLGFGKPDAPVHDAQTVYNNATPTFRWTSNEQVSFELQVLDGSTIVYNSGTIATTTTSHTITTVLANNKIYSVKIKVLNQYNLWSDYATKSFETSYTELSKPTIEVISSDKGILINGICANEVGFSHSEIWRKSNGGNFVRIGADFLRVISIEDTSVAHMIEYEYKIRAYATDGGVIESDSAKGFAVLKRTTLENIENKEIIDLLYLGSRSSQRVFDISESFFAGVNAPRFEQGVLDYEIRTLEVAVARSLKLQLTNMLRNGRVLLFKDLQGNKTYCTLSSAIEFDETNTSIKYHKVSFTLTEVPFIERDLYSGSGAYRLVYFDGAYQFDGTVDFSGVDYGGL